MFPDNFENMIRNRSGIKGKMAQITANEREIGFIDVNSLDTGYFFHCPGIGDIATHSVNRIRRIDDNPSLPQAIGNFPDIPGIGIFIE